MNVLLIGPPGVGKGTQSKLICNEYNIKHISTGDILRKHIVDNTEIGKEISSYGIDSGNFISDSLMNKILYQMKIDNILDDSYLLDGYPRTLSQAEFYINNILDKDQKYLVLHLNTDNQYILNRISNRLTCINCGSIYNLQNDLPKICGKCDKCGSNLIKRSDDKINIFKERLEIYYSITFKVVEYFRSLDVLYEIDASNDINEIFNQIKKVIGEYYDLY